MPRVLFYSLLFFLLGGVACRSTVSQTTDILESDEQSLPIDLESGELGRGQDYLWSPTERKAQASSLYLQAEYEELNGHLEAAKDKYERAYSLEPTPFLAAKLISAQAALGQMDEALPEAQRMVLLYPRSSQLRRLYGRLLVHSGFYDRAVDEFEQAITLDDASEEVYLELIDLHIQARRHDRGIALAQDVVKLFPHVASAWVRLAQLYLATEQRKLALNPAKKAYEMQSNNPEMILVYALTLDLNNQSKQAVSLYEQLYRMNPGNQELIDRMILMYRQIGGLEEALELLGELAAKPDGNTPGVRMQMAILLWELDRFAEAAVLLEQLSEELPDSERLLFMHGLGQEKLQRPDRAIEVYSRVPQESSLRVQADFRRMVILRQQEKFAESNKLGTSLIQSPAESWEIYVILASNFGDLNDFPAAVKMLDQGFQKFSDQVYLLFLRGVYEERAGKWNESVATMAEVIELEPKNSMALNFLGYMYAEKGVRLDEAEALLKRAIEIKPDDGHYLDSLGWVYYQKKDYQRAKELLLKANELAPGEGVILEHISDVYQALGDKEKAKEYIEKAVAGQLDDRDEKRVKEKYRQMTGQKD